MITPGLVPRVSAQQRRSFQGRIALVFCPTTVWAANIRNAYCCQLRPSHQARQQRSHHFRASLFASLQGFALFFFFLIV